jgi:hypothetical protein
MRRSSRPGAGRRVGAGRLSLLALLATIALALGAACSSSNAGSAVPSPQPIPGTSAASSPGAAPSSSPSFTSGAPSYCAAYANLAASVKALSELNATSGFTGVQNALMGVSTALDTFQAEAKSNFGPQVSAFRSSLTKAQAALKTAIASPSTSNLTSLGTSLAAVLSSYSMLQAVVSERCR